MDIAFSNTGLFYSSARYRQSYRKEERVKAGKNKKELCIWYY